MDLITALVEGDEAGMCLQLLVVHGHEVDLHVLDVLSREAVLAVEELHHLVLRSAHSPIILDHHVLESLDQSALDVAGLSSLDSRIDQSLATAHGVEEKFLWCQAGQVAVLDETFAGWAVVVLAEVRQRALTEAEGDTLTFYVLLTNASHDLRDVEIGALGAGGDHGLEAVPHEEILERELSRIVTSLVERAVDLELEAVEHALAWLLLERAYLGIVDDLLDLELLLLEVDLDLIESDLPRNDVLDSDRETILVEPVVDEQLRA